MIKKLLSLSCLLASITAVMASETSTSGDITYDFTDTSVWGTQTIVGTDEATAYTYNENGETSETGVTFYFQCGGGTKWNDGVYFNGKVDASSSINYVKVNVPAGYIAEVTGKGSNNRRLAVSFTLGKDENKITSSQTVTVTNATEAAADLYVFQPNVSNGVLHKIRVYNPNAVTKHSVTVNIVDNEGNPLVGAKTTEVEEGLDYAFSLAKVVEKDGTFYVLNDSEGRTDFRETVTMGTEDIAKTYTYTKDESIVCYREFNTGASVTASSGNVGTYNKGIYDLTTLETGAYTMELFIHSTLSSGVRDCSMYVDNTSVASYKDTGVKSIPLNITATATVQYGTETDRSNNFDYVIIRKTGDAVTTQTVSVGEKGKATFCPSYPMDFTNATSIAAYKASVDGNTATMTKVTAVAAGEGVVLRSASGGAAEEEVAVANPLEANEGNAMVGVLEATQLEQTSGSNTLFYLNATGFVKVPASGMTLAAGKAYLPVASTVASAAANGLSIVFGGEITGVENVRNGVNGKADALYTLGGQRVTAPKKGVCVKKGKKAVY